MKNYKIKLISTAVNDLNDIVDYLSKFSPNSALKQYDRIIEKINALRDFPEIYEEYKASLIGYKFWKMVVDNYLVFYVVKEDLVEIHRIINTRMNTNEIFSKYTDE